MTLEANFDFGRSDAGTITIGLAGEDVVCDWRGACFFSAHRLLVFSDLHLEKGSSFARRRSFVPPYDTHQTLGRASEVVAYYNPAAVICLGDSFHDDEGHERIPVSIKDMIAVLASGRDWCWIAGNHDPNAPDSLPGFSADEISIGNLTFRHEPMENAVCGEVSGHLHPAARIRRRGRSVRRACFVSDGNRLIMPAFGAFTGSLNVLSEAFDGLFVWANLQALLLGDRRIYPIGASSLVADRINANGRRA